MIELPTFLVRGGAVNTDTWRLNALGIEQMHTAREWLVAQGIGERALVLTSYLPSIKESGRIIQQGIKGASIVTDNTLFTIGQSPEKVSDLDYNLEHIVRSGGHDPNEHTGLIVVTDRALVEFAQTSFSSQRQPRMTPSDKVGSGSIVEYIPNTWPDLRKAAGIVS